MNKKMIMSKFRRKENLIKYKRLSLSRISANVSWISLGMYPDELFVMQVISHKRKHEESPEHNRNGMFHWWLGKKNMNKKEMENLKQLALVDEDIFLKNEILKKIQEYKS